MSPKARRAAAALAWLALILGVTIRSAPDQAAVVARIPWNCLVCGNDGVADAILNLLLFLPLGICLRLLGWRFGTAAGAMVLLTIGIELTQAHLLVGRDGSLGDVLTNSAGGMLGWVVVPLLIRCSKPSVSQARRMVVVLLLAHAAVWIATAVGLQPAFSDQAPWTMQITGQGEFSDPFPGAVLSEQWNGRSLAEGPAPHPAGIGDTTHLVVSVRRNHAPLPAAGATLFQVVDTASRVQLSVAEKRADLLVEIPLRATRWLLHSPVWEYADAFDLPVDRPSTLEWSWTPRRAVLTTRADTEPRDRVRRQLAVTLSLGWAFIHPFTRRIGPSAALWSGLWLAWWFGLLGWSAGWLARRERWLAGVIAVSMFAGCAAATGHTLVLSDMISAAVAFIVLVVLSDAVARRRERPQG